MAYLLHAIKGRSLPDEVHVKPEGGIQRGVGSSTQFHRNFFRWQDLNYVTSAYPRFSAAITGIAKTQFVTANRTATPRA